MSNMTNTAKAHLFTLGATILVATSLPVVVGIAHGMDSLLLTLLRFAFATLLFAPIVHARYGLVVPSRRVFLGYSLLGACLVLFFWAMFAALRQTSALNAASIITLLPLTTFLISFVVLKERLDVTARFALVIGLIGALWVVFRGDLSALKGFDFNNGDAVLLGATLVMGVYGTLVKYLHRGEPMAVMTFWTLACGSFWLLLLSIPQLTQMDWTGVPGSVYVGIIYLALVGTLITIFSFQWSTAVIGPTKVMSYTYLQPGLVMVVGIPLGQALPPAMTWPGLGLTALATLVLQGAPLRRVIKRAGGGGTEEGQRRPAPPRRETESSARVGVCAGCVPICVPTSQVSSDKHDQDVLERTP